MEIVDSGQADARSISGHSTPEVARIYNEANVEQAKRIAVKRREHMATLGAAAEEDVAA